MNTKKIIVFSAVAIIIVGAGAGYFLSQKKESPVSIPMNEQQQTGSDSTVNTPAVQDEASTNTPPTKALPIVIKKEEPFITYVVVYTDSGYTPPSLTIKKGDNVTFKNMSTKGMWTASAMHPTHKEYPTTGGCISSTFDSCKSILPGEEWSFNFDKVGTWRYHNHVNSSQYGSITVE